MQISKLFTRHELELLYSGANSAIWRSHHIAATHAMPKAREEDFVATLVSDGIQLLADRWVPLLRTKGVSLRLSGVFCHGHPQVSFGAPREQVELADLLVVHHHLGRKRSWARAILIQAKMAADATLVLSPRDAQLKLFSTWPPFEFVTGGLKPGFRDLKEYGKGSRYALVLNKQSYPEDILWADQCPWAESKAQVRLTADRSLAKLLGDMLLGKDGRSFQISMPKDDWSRTIHELLDITGQRTYTRKRLKRENVRRATDSSAARTSLMYTSGSALNMDAGNGRKASPISSRYFGQPLDPDFDGDGGGWDHIDNIDPPEGGIATFIIESHIGEG